MLGRRYVLECCKKNAETGEHSGVFGGSEVEAAAQAILGIRKVDGILASIKKLDRESRKDLIQSVGVIYAVERLTISGGDING